HLRDDEHLVAPPRDRRADELLGVAVHLRRVDVRHAEVEASAQRLDGGLPAGRSDVPRALADHRDVAAARTERASLHGRVLTPTAWSAHAPARTPRSSPD